MIWKRNFVNIAFELLLLIIILNYSLAEENEDFVDEFSDDQAKETKEKYVAPPYESPKIDKSRVYFLELFDDKKAIGKNWFKSESKKEGVDESISKYDGEWSIGSPAKASLEGDFGLIVLNKARHHAIAAKLQKPFKFEGKSLVVQYEVKYEEGQECGGGYLKLLESEVADNLRLFNDKSPYVIMFGPDKCGMTSKVHFILRHKNPKNGSVDEHHAKQPSKSIHEYFEDKNTHLYTLVIKSDNNFHVYVDQQELITGNLLTDLEPPITPPKQISDPNDKKPEDWDDRAMIEDPDARKPDDWDENQPKEVLDEEATMPTDWLEEEEPLIPDPEAQKPKDWDDEMDGEWEPRKISNPECEGKSGCGKWTRPMKANPLYKGKWTPSKIKNPNYKGKWTPRLIDNPNYFEGIILHSIGALGIEIWTMSSGIVFDNIIVTEDKNVAKSLAKQTFEIKKAQEKIQQSAVEGKQSVLKSVMDATHEKPWLWAVIILAILLPIILISIFCFGRKSSKRAHSKKTDEPVEDEEVVEMEEPEKDEKEAEEEEEAAVVEEIPGDAEERSSQSAASSSATDSKPSTPKSEKKKDAPIEPTQPTTEDQPASTSPRARRVRVRRQD